LIEPFSRSAAGGRVLRIYDDCRQGRSSSTFPRTIVRACYSAHADTPTSFIQSFFIVSTTIALWCASGRQLKGGVNSAVFGVRRADEGESAIKAKAIWPMEQWQPSVPRGSFVKRKSIASTAPHVPTEGLLLNVADDLLQLPSTSMEERPFLSGENADRCLDIYLSIVVLTACRREE